MGEINNDDDWRNGLDISGLSLMDEDDSLLLLFPDPTSGNLRFHLLFFFYPLSAKVWNFLIWVVISRCGFVELMMMMMCLGTDKEGLDWFGEDELSEVMKYNLRKSLAWDKAFFTNAGKFFFFFYLCGFDERCC